MANEHPSRRIIEIAARRLGDMTLDPEIRSVLAFVLNAAPDRHPKPALAAFAPPGAHAHYNGLNALLQPYGGQTLEKALRVALAAPMKPYTGSILGDDDEPETILGR